MKRFPWISLTLLLVCYAGFGWYLSGFTIPYPRWMVAGCYQMSGLAAPPPTTLSEKLKTKEFQETKQYGEPNRLTPQNRDSAKPNAAENLQEAIADKTDGVCKLAFTHNLPIGLVAVCWIFVSSLAFISPLQSFSRFISRWFRSDTVALMTIITIAGMAAVILYWLHVFLQIFTILAAEALARIDIQTARMSGSQAFWILTIVSLAGLMAGWLANGVL